MTGNHFGHAANPVLLHKARADSIKQEVAMPSFSRRAVSPGAVSLLAFRLLALSVALAFTSSLQNVHAAEPPLIRVTTKSAKSHVGTLVKDESGRITLNDVKTGKEISIPREEVLRVTNPISLDEAARIEGLATITSWKISNMASQEAPVGKVARVTAQVVYITLGEKSGVKMGQKLDVFRNNGEIIDPDTGAVLAIERPRIAALEIVEVNSAFSKAKITNELEVTLQVGDEVEPNGQKMRVAVCPLLNEDGTLTNVGAGIAEDLTTALVQKKITVVERTVLDMVLGELIVQNTILFDPKTAQNLGQLTGASFVLTGKIVPDRKVGKAYVRLINVATGEIVFAVSSTIKLGGARSITPRRMSKNEISSTSSSSRTTTRRGSSGKSVSGKLGASRRLPAFLGTDGRYARTDDRGIKLQGFDSPSIRNISTIRTRQFNYLANDFTFEVLVSLSPGDKIAYIGLGLGKPDQSYNGLTDSVYLRFHSPDHGDGKVDVTCFKKGFDILGKVTHSGTHRVSIIKEGDLVTFLVDPENDGPTDDDMELTIPNIREFAPFFHSKNMPLFFAGSGTFLEASVSN